MKEQLTIASFIVKVWYDALIAMGISSQLLEKRIGFDLCILENVDGRIPLDQHFHLMEVGIELTNNPALPFYMGEQSTPENLGIVGRVLMNSPTFGDATYQAARYSKLFCDSCYLEVKIEGDQVYLIYQMEVPQYNKIPAIEGTFSSTITNIRTLSPVEFTPQEVHFQYSTPQHIEEYHRLFKCPLYFNQPENMIVFDREYMNIKLPNHDPYMLELLTLHAETLLKKLAEVQNLRNKVSKLILEHLPTGNLDIEMIAEQLNVSRWTLNRKLRGEETSFQELLQDMRQQMAINYLQKPKLSVSEVAFLVGFSEPSAFNRAFKRWSGRSPGEYRKENLSLSIAS